MITTQVNEYALATAAKLVVGDEAMARITALYQVIDQAMFAGYELGQIDGEKVSDKWLDDAFDNGWELGEAHGMNDADAREATGYDEGYLDGVGDARARPAQADDTVCEIINEMAQQALNGEYDASLVTDSGDEQVYDPFRGVY